MLREREKVLRRMGCLLPRVLACGIALRGARCDCRVPLPLPLRLRHAATHPRARVHALSRRRLSREPVRSELQARGDGPRIAVPEGGHLRDVQPRGLGSRGKYADKFFGGLQREGPILPWGVGKLARVLLRPEEADQSACKGNRCALREARLGCIPVRRPALRKPPDRPFVADFHSPRPCRHVGVCRQTLRRGGQGTTSNFRVAQWR
mmetsp:Transcript_23381/g.70211  ORF Transcript_23381/g.70211 Transcript_23381/m.70211 type:complete len:207 (+) Transcript_23381:315-935(+)